MKCKSCRKKLGHDVVCPHCLFNNGRIPTMKEEYPDLFKKIKDEVFEYLEGNLAWGPDYKNIMRKQDQINKVNKNYERSIDNGQNYPLFIGKKIKIGDDEK